MIFAIVTPTVAQGGDSIAVSIGDSPYTLDPALSYSTDEQTCIVHLFEGLTKVSASGKTVPGMASSWEMKDGGKTFIFHLRDAKWSDGSSVLSSDFVYAWQRVVDPRNYAEYAFQLYSIKNASKINWLSSSNVTQSTLNTLGVKAIDDKTLEVNLEYPFAQFIELTNFPTLFPVKKCATVAFDKNWSMDAKKIITNGPYTLKSIEKDSQLVLSKDSNYWDTSLVMPSEITCKFYSYEQEVYNAFKSKSILYAEEVMSSKVSSLSKEGVLKKDPQSGIYYLSIGTKNKPLTNVKVRKALSLAINRQYIIDKIAKIAAVPAGAFVPYGVLDTAKNKSFRTVGGNYFNPNSSGYKSNVKLAKKLLSQAGYKDGKKFPTIQLISNTEGPQKVIMAELKKEWKNNLGINTSIKSSQWDSFEPKRERGDFDIARDGWLGDYSSPITFLNLFDTSLSNNHSKWKSTKYNSYLKTARSTLNQAKAMSAMHSAEKLLMNELPIIPLYYYSDYSMQSKNLRNVYSSPLGFKYFMYATVV